jgi:hypothetical protein
VQALPLTTSFVQGLLSLQSAGGHWCAGSLLSQLSPLSSLPLPQLQMALLVGVWTQITSQVAAAPVITSSVQGLPSSQLVGQLPSQISVPSTMPFRHSFGQSRSLFELQLVGQQPSPNGEVQAVMGL